MQKQNSKNLLITLGNFFFHFRNMLFPLYMLAILLLTRPMPYLAGASFVAKYWRALGLVMAILGEVIRLFTIGFRYIERGGKNRRIFASKLVTDGIYSHVRNPMYVGNILVVAGLSLLTASFVVVAISIPLFAFIYLCIVSAEEQFLLKTFGSEYADYCQNVSRFFPKLRGVGTTLSGMFFEWKRALRKDYGNIAMIMVCFTLLPLWRQFFEATDNRFSYLFEGHDLHEHIELAGWYLSFLLIGYIGIRFLKKKGWLADSQYLVHKGHH